MYPLVHVALMWRLTECVAPLQYALSSFNTSAREVGSCVPMSASCSSSRGVSASPNSSSHFCFLVTAAAINTAPLITVGRKAPSSPSGAAIGTSMG
ncbi:unnamed protein product [Phytophthora fragariaefolia]|uniref:Unnamed protein product n=1 Tax=Phytophthora fragariaefolia TaxID=1490495 RepID=A0A9W6XY87_9STRA|nr:unnamed protein product [Phytophthora fragariaefolia]